MIKTLLKKIPGVRLAYEFGLHLVYRRGIRRVVNGRFPIRILPKYRHLSMEYEPDVWQALLGELRSGDHVWDIGAHCGLYAIPLAAVVGRSGSVLAVEGDPGNTYDLRRQIDLNGVGTVVRPINAVCGDRCGVVEFAAIGDQESHMVPSGQDGGVRGDFLPMITLDALAEHAAVDVLKIDVEGAEELVLRGGTALFDDRSNAPRAIFIEVHPYAWASFGTTSSSLLGFLSARGYEVKDLAGARVDVVSSYGEIVAWRTAEV